MRATRFFLLSALTLCFAALAVAQSSETGLPPFGSFHGSNFDLVSLKNGNLHVEIPLWSLPQRAAPNTGLRLVYDMPTWLVTKSHPTPTTTEWRAAPVNGEKVYWNYFSDPVHPAATQHDTITKTCFWFAPDGRLPFQYNVHVNYVMTDSHGTKHPFNLRHVDTHPDDRCTDPVPSTDTGFALDGSGYKATIVANNANSVQYQMAADVGQFNGNLGGELSTGGSTNIQTDANGVVLYRIDTVLDSNGTSQQFRVDYGAVSSLTSFCSFLPFQPFPSGTTCVESVFTLNLPQKLTLPNGKFYQFTWSQDGNADLLRIDLPTGGSISYGYGGKVSVAPFQQGGVNQYKARRMVTSRTVSDGVLPPQQWGYLPGGIVHDPLGNEQVHSFGAPSGGADGEGIYEVQVDYYQGTAASGKLLRTIKKDYLAETDLGLPDSTPHGTINARLIRTTTILGDAAQTQSKTETDYETLTGTDGTTYTFLNPIEQREFAYGTVTTPGTLLRRTVFTYLHTGNQNYLSRNIVHRVLSTTVYDGSSHQVAQTVNEYDNYLHSGQQMLASSAIQHDPAYDTNFIYRGNVTAVSHWRNTDGAMLTSTNQYDDAGNLLSTIDPLGHKTSYDYTDSWGNGSCTPVGQAKVFATTITNALSQPITKSYNSCTATLASVTDPNSQTTNYTYDAMNRLAIVVRPDNGRTENTYDDTQLLVTSSTVLTLPDSRIFSRQHYDQLGRVVKAELCEDGSSACATSIKADTTYDGIGQISIVSNPYRTANDPGPTNGITRTDYDGLGRVTQVTRQDGSISAISYTGSCTTTTDEALNARRGCSDALGRLIEVDEPGGPDPGTQATASVTISGAFNSTWVAAGTPHLAATGTAIASVAMSDGSSHDFYFDTNQHLCQMSWFSGSGWYDQDLTSMTEAALPSAGSSIAAVALGGVIHVFYQGGNQHIYDMNWTGSIWQNLDMTVLTGASPVSNTKMAIVATGSSNTPMMFYEGTNQHLFCIYWNAPTTAWLNADLHSLSGATNLIAPNGAISAAMWGTTGNIHALFLDTNQNLNRIVWSGTAWITNNLTSITGAALAVAGSKLTTIATGTPIDLMTFYEGPGQHIYSIYWNGSAGTYQALDFTVWSGATNIAAVLTSLANNPVGPHMFYFSSNQHLDDMLWNGSAWVNADLTSLANTTAVPASGSSLSSHGTTGGNSYNIFFEGGNQHIYHTYYSPSASAWFNEDPLVTASNFVVDSGTVSLTIPNGGSNFTATVCYGVSTNPICAGQPVNASPGDIANALAAMLNGAGSPVNASSSGATLSLTWRTTGAVASTVAPMTSTPDNPAVFPNGSFTSTSGTFSGGIAPSNQSLRNPFVTQYQYDALGNLLRVDQKGTAPSDSTQWRTRTFTYDSLSRLLTANNPESGTITYSYDLDGNLLQKTSPAPNQTGSATQTVSYCYDALHRVTGKGYGAQSCPLATPVVTYAYDSGTNAIGHLTSLTDQAGTASYTYDVLGRLATETRTLTGANNAAIPKNISYEYNLDGSLYKLHYPSGKVVTYTPDLAGRPVSAVDSGSGTNYVTGATYAPSSALASFISGSGGVASITNSFTYNQRLQPLAMSATIPGQTLFSISYDFHAGNGTAGSGADNGNVWGITNNKDTTRSQTFGYDALNRLTSAQNAGTDCGATVLEGKKKFWGNTYTYDAWGNLTNKVLIQTPILACSGEGLSVTAGANNRLGSGYLYDAAGNMTFNATPPTQTYTYDQENRLTGAAGYAYTYDADGNRVRKSSGSTGTLYWYMTPGIVGESDLSGNLTDEYVFFDGERVARKSTNGVFYYFSDHLKTASVITDSAGNIKSESDFYPWGGELQFVNNDSNHYKFTGKERDSETQLDYFGARYYSNGLGRWVSADWSAVPVPVPYADFHDPQSLNLYGYTRDLPTTTLDPDGHCPPCPMDRLPEDKKGDFGEALKGAWNRVVTLSVGIFNRLSDGQVGFSPGGQEQLQPQNSSQRLGAQAVDGTLILAPVIGEEAAAARAMTQIVDMSAEVRMPSVLPSMTSNLTADEIKSGLESATLRTTQDEISAPVVNRYIDMLRAGSEAPPIKVDGDIIVDGNHRYAAGVLEGRPPATTPGTVAPSQASKAKPVKDIKVTSTDYGNN